MRLPLSPSERRTESEFHGQGVDWKIQFSAVVRMAEPSNQQMK